jgi:hypothetical protein
LGTFIVLVGLTGLLFGLSMLVISGFTSFKKSWETNRSSTIGIIIVLGILLIFAVASFGSSSKDTGNLVKEALLAMYTWFLKSFISLLGGDPEEVAVLSSGSSSACPKILTTCF